MSSYKFVSSLSKSATSYLKYFLIFLAWPVLEIGVSVTLYIFIFLVNASRKSTRRSFLNWDAQSQKFYILFLIALASFIFAPWSEVKSSVTGDVIILVQYGYWMLIAVFFMNVYPLLDKRKLNKTIFYGLLILIVHFFLFNIALPIPFLRTWVSRNGFVYTILALWPFAASHIFSRYGRSNGNSSMVLLTFLMLLTDGRSGVVIILIENIFLFSVYNKASANFLRIALIIAFPFLYFFGTTIYSDENRKALGNLITPYSERIGEFIIGEGYEGDLSLDKSWLTRKLMIEKGVEIISKYPFFGVGVGHFTNYNAELVNLYNPEFQRLTGGAYDEAYYNTKSSHNSYVHVASEMGLIGFFCLIWILFPLVLKALRFALANKLDDGSVSLIALIGICIHFYTITSLPGTVTWFVIGVAASQLHKQRHLSNFARK